MNCPFCNNQIADHTKFCNKCGHQIVRCPSCNDVIRKKVKFCPKDGTPLPVQMLADLPDQAGAAAPKIKGRGGAPGQAPKMQFCKKCGKQFVGTTSVCNNCQTQKKSPLIIILLIVLLVALLGIVGFLVYGLVTGKDDTDDGASMGQTGATIGTTAFVSGDTEEAEDEEIEAEDESSGGFEEDNTTSGPLSTALNYNAGAREYNGHAYAIFNYQDYGLSSFQACEAFCENMGGHLAVINSQDENDFIYGFIRDSGLTLAFFGYTDEGSEGNWRWVDGSANTYENWCRVKGKEQPNNKGGEENYAEFYKETANGTWNDSIFGANTYRFVCEWE